MCSAETHPHWLPLPVFATVVQNAPLVAIDLVVLRGTGASAEMLLGLRRNRPAQGFWFAPGGRIHKGETLQAAMQRTVQTELGSPLAGLSALAGQPVPLQWLGVYEHFYADSFPDPASSTHYVVLAHTLQLPAGFGLPSPPEQHSQWQWWPLAQAATSPQVHAHTQAYAQALGVAPAPGA
jgi:colanic acid biosynthesis protein WcaH